MSQPNDTNEPSPASAGSRPVAWAVLPPALPGVKYLVTLDKDEAERIACGAMRVVPLYEQPQPTLTDEERRAIEAGIANCEDITYGGPNDEEAAAVLRRLLERLG